jgi:hypothetical protein
MLRPLYLPTASRAARHNCSKQPGHGTSPSPRRAPAMSGGSQHLLCRAADRSKLLTLRHPTLRHQSSLLTFDAARASVSASPGGSISTPLSSHRTASPGITATPPIEMGLFSRPQRS